MPCIFCIAALALVAGALSTAVVDKLEDDLAKKAEGPLKKLADTESVLKWEFDVRVGRKKVPVAVTVYKEHGRVRIQILSHELSREEAERVEDEIAEAIGAEVVSRSQPEEEEKVKEAEEEQPETVEPEKVPVGEKEAAEAPKVEKRR